MKQYELVTNISALPTISINDEALKAQLTEEMAVYKTLVFTEEQKAEAKADLANLRKLRTEVDNRRKEVKREYNKPLEEFESKVKGLLSIIDEPIGLIDGKVKEFEEKRKAEKRELINKIYAEELKEFPRVTLESIYKTTWENATCNESAIRADMQEIKLSVDRDLNIIISLKSDGTDKAIDKYYEAGRNLAIAINYINEYEATKAEVIKRQEEEAKKALEIRRELMDEENIVSENTSTILRQNEGSIEATTIGFPTGNQIEVHIAVVVDEDKVDDLMQLLRFHGYKAERTI